MCASNIFSDQLASQTLPDVHWVNPAMKQSGGLGGLIAHFGSILRGACSWGPTNFLQLIKQWSRSRRRQCAISARVMPLHFQGFSPMAGSTHIPLMGRNPRCSKADTEQQTVHFCLITELDLSVCTPGRHPVNVRFPDGAYYCFPALVQPTSSSFCFLSCSFSLAPMMTRAHGCKQSSAVHEVVYA